MDSMNSETMRENLLTVQIDNVKTFTTILKALHFKEVSIVLKVNVLGHNIKEDILHYS